MASPLGLDRRLLARCPPGERVRWGTVSALAGVNLLLSGFGAGYFLGELCGSAGAGIVGGVLWGLVFFNLQRFVLSSRDRPSLRPAALLTFGLKLLLFGFFGALTAVPIGLFVFRDEIGLELARRQAGRANEILRLRHAHYLRELVEIAAADRAEDGRLADKSSRLAALEGNGSLARYGADRLLEEILVKAREEHRLIAEEVARRKEHLTARAGKLEESRARERVFWEQRFRDAPYLIDGVRLLRERWPREARLLVTWAVALFISPALCLRLFGRRGAYEAERLALEREVRERFFADFRIRYEALVRKISGEEYAYPDVD